MRTLVVIVAAVLASCASGSDQELEGGLPQTLDAAADSAVASALAAAEAGGPVGPLGDAGSMPQPSLGCPASPSATPAALHRAALEVLTPMTPCGFSDCHAGRGKAGLTLLGATDLRALLVGKSTCEAPAVPLVDGRGGELGLRNSWLWLKLDSEADAEGALPVNAAWGVGQSCGQLPSQPYGVLMPLASPRLMGMRRDAVRAWICAGAPGPS
jgi:hypothetical protein